MDQVKFGKFLAALRKQSGITQEALGEKLGVSNKTVSRWENGRNLPDIEMLPILADMFHVSVDELLAGEKTADGSRAGETTAAAPEASSFSFEERKAFFKKKWRREHVPLFAILAVILIAAIVLPLAFHKPWLVGFVPLIAFVEYGYQNNRMMIYVENNLYE